MKANKGIALPVMVAMTALLGLAVIAWLPATSGANLQKWRFRHMTWWHWQQAVVHYYHVKGLWPDSLMDVQAEFGLPPQPNFIEGYKVPEGFTVRLTGVDTNQEKQLVRGLSPYVEINVSQALDVELTPSSEGAVPATLISRYNATDIQAALDMNTYNLNSVGVLAVNDQVAVSGITQVAALDAQTLLGNQLNYAGEVVVDSFYWAAQPNAIGTYTNKIKILYVQLDDYMTSQEGIANRPHRNIDAADCASRGCFQLAEAQGASQLWPVGER